MTTAIILFTTLLLDPLGTAPDLCADVYLDTDNQPITDVEGTTLSRFCEWTGPEVPIWDDDVCCTTGTAGAECTLAPADPACDKGKRMYCEYGELFADMSVVCYQPFRSACELSNCSSGTVQSPDDIQGDLLCCYNGNCYEFTSIYLEDCDGLLGWCSYGYSKEDGTVDCYD